MSVPVPVNVEAHEAITFMAPYMNVEAFIDQVHSVYPEVNIEIVPYSGDNTTTCIQNMVEANDLPDVCTITVYNPMTDDMSDKLIDLSGYDFTDNYVESLLQEVSDEGAIYLLPSIYNCYGITYNKTLLRENGWELPTSFTELEELAEKAEAAGITLCLNQIQYPGYGFQYLCNIADAAFLGTLDGKRWQKDYLSGNANVSDTPGMMDAMAYIQKWRDIGMLNGNGNPTDDNETRAQMKEGKALFLIGSTNGIVEAEGNQDRFGLMPYLSQDGSQNVFILSVGRYFGISKRLELEPQKLEDALKVMRVLSTVEGTAALYPESKIKSSLMPFKNAKTDGTYYADIADDLNAGKHRSLHLFRLGKHHRHHRHQNAGLYAGRRFHGGGHCPAGRRPAQGGQQHAGHYHHRYRNHLPGGLRQTGWPVLCPGHRQRFGAGFPGYLDSRQLHRAKSLRCQHQAVRQRGDGL